MVKRYVSMGAMRDDEHLQTGSPRYVLAADYDAPCQEINDKWALENQALAAELAEADKFCKQWKAIAHEGTDSIVALKARIRALETALRDFKDHGLRFDLNPTLDLGCTQYAMLAWWHSYIKRMDESVRERAASALETSDPSKRTGPYTGDYDDLAGDRTTKETGAKDA